MPYSSLEDIITTQGIHTLHLRGCETHGSVRKRTNYNFFVTHQYLSTNNAAMERGTLPPLSSPTQNAKENC